jgi:lysophospholipase L1-like esterase
MSALRRIGIGALLALGVAALGCADSRSADCGDCARRFGERRVVACLGDSNTHMPEQRSWCEILDEEGGPTRFLNYGFPGGVAAPGVPRFPVLDAAYWLDRALVLAPPSLVIFAFGTNDLRGGTSPDQVVEAYRKLKARSEEAGARVLIALTPPMAPKTNDKSPEVRELNDLLRREFPGETVDFYTDFDLATDLVPDGLHFTPAGQEKRAARVRAALTEHPL